MYYYSITFAPIAATGISFVWLAVSGSRNALRAVLCSTLLVLAAFAVVEWRFRNLAFDVVLPQGWAMWMRVAERLELPAAIC
jgi:hypothetical protein